MYTISKMFDFDAAHQLSGLAPGHKCSRLHGHTYRVEVILQSVNLDSLGMVRDYGDLDEFNQWLKITVDHRNLNDRYHQPTTEVLVYDFYHIAKKMFPEVVAVKVYESATTYAEYRE